MEYGAKFPEDIEKIASDLARADYHTDSIVAADWFLYRAIGVALMNERAAEHERCNQIIRDARQTL